MEYDYFQIPLKTSTNRESFYSLEESSLKNSSTIIPHKSWLEWKRPSFLTHLSTSYTHKTSLIPFDSPKDYIKKCVLLCAKKIKSRGGTKTLRWREYNVVLSPSQLELHSLNKKSCNIFQREHIISWTGSSEIFQLSLISSIDFSWKLESKTAVFYFQADNVRLSQSWYRALYNALPPFSKKLLPLYIDLCVPGLSIQIRIPLEALKTDENAELTKVRESALTLLHHHGHRPNHWNSRTVGLCWRINDEISWILIPNQLEPAYLIEPRLIEKKYQLELRYYQPPTPTIFIPTFYESIYDGRENKERRVALFDHYLLVQKPATSGWKKRFKRIEQDQDHVLSSAKYAFDLSLHEGKVFFPLKKYEEISKSSKQIKKEGMLYVKSTDRFTFEQRTCLLSTDGVLGVFRSDHTKEVTMKQNYYIYSGECCRYISGLPSHWACRMFEDGYEEPICLPYQCTFIIRNIDQKEYIFLAKNIKEKEAWLRVLVK